MQISFINPPTLKLDFTGAANVADSDLIDSTVRKVILSVISSMFVLPNRFLVKLDSANDYFKTYQPHSGVLRLTVEGATGIAGKKRKGAKRLLDKVLKDVPDCYCKVNVGAEEVWKTSTKKNDTDPNWGETHDFLVMDHDQGIFIDIQDDDLAGDDDIGLAVTTVKQLLLNGGTQELGLVHKSQPTEGKITIKAQYYRLVPEAGGLTAESSGGGAGQIVGLATILVASAFGLQGERDKLNPAIRVSWGKTEFKTAAKTYSAGTDIFNPSWDTSFRVPVTAEMVANPSAFVMALMDKGKDVGTVEVPFAEVMGAPGLVLEKEFEVGGGARIRASISLRGTRLAQ
jgi:Ca2+-dependent lipid-binding protein